MIRNVCIRKYINAFIIILYYYDILIINNSYGFINKFTIAY